MVRQAFRAAIVATALLVLAAPTQNVAAQIMISANDGKGVLVDGINTVPATREPDHVTIHDLGAKPPKLLARVEVPTSLVGPPSSVAIAPDQSFALVTAATGIDPANQQAIVPASTLSVIDLKGASPTVIATLDAGAGASGVAINRAGTLALVANRQEGTVSVFTIAATSLLPAGKVRLGDARSGPSAVAFTPDGRSAFVTRDGDHKISVLAIDGPNVTPAGRDIHAGLRPYALDISRKGDFAAVASVGMGDGDADTISLIDLGANPPRTVDTISVGQTPEMLAISPDDRHVAVAVMNGTNQPAGAPFHNSAGVLAIYAVKGMKLARVGDVKIGRWCQGVGWRRDGKLVVVQCMVEAEIQMFSFDGRRLKAAGSIKVGGGPAGLAVARD